MRYSKSVKLDRYKLAIQVTIGEMKGQGLKISSKCLWDPAFDNYASYTFTTVRFFASEEVLKEFVQREEFRIDKL